jgi:hypothetical protein
MSTSSLTKQDVCPHRPSVRKLDPATTASTHGPSTRASEDVTARSRTGAVGGSKGFFATLYSVLKDLFMMPHGRDLKDSTEELYNAAPDVLSYSTMRDADLRHLKQRLVRAQMCRNQYGAKLMEQSRMHQAQLNQLRNQLLQAQCEAFELRSELQVCDYW